MTDLAFFVITGGRTYWYNDAGELIIQSKPGDRCVTCGEQLPTGEGHYYPDRNGFLCWLHALQRFMAEVQAKAYPNTDNRGLTGALGAPIKSVAIQNPL